MKAAIRSRFGPPDILEVRDVPVPELADDCALVRVRASSVNRAEWYGLTGRPLFGRLMGMGVLKPKTDRLGADFAGVVEAVGKDVTHVRPGDDVYGGRTGAFAEYVCVKDAVVKMPSNLTYEEAACIPIAGLTALQGLRDKADVRAGQKVLVNGASGGVGTFAVQIAKALGAEVHAVCRTRNVELVRSLGADRVFDYTQEDFTRSGERYDVLYDVAGSKSFRACKRVLAPGAVVVKAGAPMSKGLLGPLKHIIAFRVAAMGSGHPVAFFIAKFNRPDLDALRGLCEAGKVKPHVEKVYPLDEIADALRYMGEGHARSKVAIAM
jgi:NADPH:quinone reductase-like Zn-dependent oxidoreductase